MRFGVITHVVGDAGSATVIDETIELAQVAESAGFTSFWVAQHHFGSHRGHVSSPLVLLAALARETDRIQLGTAVVAGGLEHPVRLAEDAAMVDALSGGRLQLGLGAGADPIASEVFGVDHAHRHQALNESLHALCAELEGERLCPRAVGLRRRMWLATGSAEGYALAANLRMGILAGRRGSPDPREDARAARRMAAHRSRTGDDGAPLRTGLSRVVFCADPATSRTLLAPGIRRWIGELAPPGRFPEGYTVDDYLAARHVMFGDGAAIREQMTTDPCSAEASDFLVNVPQMHPEFADNARSIKRFGSEVIDAAARRH